MCIYIYIYIYTYKYTDNIRDPGIGSSGTWCLRMWGPGVIVVSHII